MPVAGGARQISAKGLVLLKHAENIDTFVCTGFKVIKLFFKLSSAKHEISTAHYYFYSPNKWKTQNQNSKTINLSCS